MSLLGNVQVVAKVGDIRAEDLHGSVALRTDTGNIDMVVPKDVFALVNASTRVGSISSDLDLNVTGAQVVQAGNVRTALGSSATGVLRGGDDILGGGHEAIKLEVNVGSIRIRSAEKAR
jgi:hypothetical protein